ncbi:hypothetical protein GQ44DRAFT_721741 [Phaeosphaeriaceae sp. PMI808]|nr:hypothetical protein GQ44DRAFT_721741 [Phaeosphaeriaceae sp. PMI808]
MRIKAKSKKGDKKESPHLIQYREYYEKGEYEQWFRKLMDDIYRNLGDLKSGSADLTFKQQIFRGRSPEQYQTNQLVRIFIQSSGRLCAMFAALADQIDNRNEKAIIFALNPWEQQLYTVILRIMNYKAFAHLAIFKGDHKAKIIQDFQSDLARWVDPGFEGVAENDSEVLVLSYHMNSGLNLHTTCHNIYAPSPPPPYSIWVQTIGRIARFGQPFECVVMTYIVTKTYNIAQYSTMMRNALTTIAALVCDVQGKDETMAGVTKVSFSELRHFHGYEDTLVDDRENGFNELLETGKVDLRLDQNEKFLRILNVILGRNVKVTAGSREGYSIAKANPTFTQYAPLLQATKPQRTPSKNAAADATPGGTRGSRKRLYVLPPKSLRNVSPFTVVTCRPVRLRSTQNAFPHSH